jgi:hypothetical protein
MISGLTGISIGGRFIFFSVFFLHLAIALYIKENNIFNIQKIRNSFRTSDLVKVLIFILLLPSGIYRVKEMKKHIRRFVDKPARIHSYDSPAKSYFFLSEHLSYSDVVLADADEGWVIPAITGAKVVAPQKLNPLIVDEGNQRRIDVASFFKTRLSFKERIKLITKYHVTHIMVNLKDEKDWDPSFTKDLEVIGIEEARKNRVILYKVAQSH